MAGSETIIAYWCSAIVSTDYWIVHGVVVG
nr:MAG TPA: hypothetical protein [Caudoviricetes sp.]